MAIDKVFIYNNTSVMQDEVLVPPSSPMSFPSFWFGLVWFVLVCFGLFWFVLVCFILFCFVLFTLNLGTQTWIDSDLR